MDQITQQNAVMVEETSDAIRRLSDESGTLLSLVDQFRLDQADGAAVQRVA